MGKYPKYFLIVILFFIFSCQTSISNDVEKQPKFIDVRSNPKLAYFAEVHQTIQKNLLFNSKRQNENENLKAMVVVKILSNGEIEDYWFDKKSENEAFDSSVENAIHLSSPLPAFFDGMEDEFVKLGLELKSNQ